MNSVLLHFLCLVHIPLPSTRAVPQADFVRERVCVGGCGIPNQRCSYTGGVVVALKVRVREEGEAVLS